MKIPMITRESLHVLGLPILENASFVLNMRVVLHLLPCLYIQTCNCIKTILNSSTWVYRGIVAVHIGLLWNMLGADLLCIHIEKNHQQWFLMLHFPGRNPLLMYPINILASSSLPQILDLCLITPYVSSSTIAFCMGKIIPVFPARLTLPSLVNNHFPNQSRWNIKSSRIHWFIRFVCMIGCNSWQPFK